MGLKTVKVPMGLVCSYFAPITAEPASSHPTYGSVLDMGANVKSYLSITTASGSIWGDDEELYYDESFVNAQLDAETTQDDLAINAALQGHTYATGLETSGKDDRSPYGGYGAIRHLINKQGQHIFRGMVYYKVKPMASSEKDEADTKKENFDPKMYAVSMKVTCDNTGAWRDREDFSALAQAESWLATKLGNGTSKVVRVAVHGSGTVTPMVAVAASGSNVELSVGGSPTALYDNGTLKTSSISSNKYTISSISADHEVVVIY